MVKVASKDETEEAPVVAVNAGDYLFRAGESAPDMILVQEGTVELVKDESGEPLRLGLLEPGDFAGEEALLEGKPHAFSARAVTAAKVVRIDGGALHDLIRQEPDIALRMIRRLSRRLTRGMEAAALASRSGTGPVPRAGGDVSATGVPVAGLAARLVHAGGAEFPLPLDRDAVIGREDPSSGFVPDIVLTSVDSQRSLSRRHASITRRGAEFLLNEEPGVRNGTFVNGKRVKAGAPVRLNDGDEVSFGLIKTTFRVG